MFEDIKSKARLAANKGLGFVQSDNFKLVGEAASKSLSIVRDFKEAGTNPVSLVATTVSVASQIGHAISAYQNDSDIKSYFKRTYPFGDPSNAITSIVARHDSGQKSIGDFLTKMVTSGLFRKGEVSDDDRHIFYSYARDNQYIVLSVFRQSDEHMPIVSYWITTYNKDMISFTDMLVREEIWKNKGCFLSRDEERDLLIADLNVRESLVDTNDDSDIDKLISKIEVYQRNGTEASFFFFGPPGVGKTQTALRLANKLDKNILVAARDQLAMQEIGDFITTFKPDIVLFDDVDKGSISTFFTEFDFIKKKVKDVIWIITANNVKSLGTAFARPGRAGRWVNFSLPKEEDIPRLIDIGWKNTDMKYDESTLIELFLGLSHDWIVKLCEASVEYSSFEEYILDTRDIINTYKKLSDDSDDDSDNDFDRSAFASVRAAKRERNV